METVESVVKIAEEEVRRIEISILDEEGHVVFEVSGGVTRKTAHKFMEGVGYAFIPYEPPRMPRAVLTPTALGKISCASSLDCTDYPTKCRECAKNKAKSYFKPKEE